MMERMSHAQYSQLGVSVNTTGSLQASTSFAQVTPRTTLQNVNAYSNITLAQPQPLDQILFQGNTKPNGSQIKGVANSAHPHPLIIGNVNAANILAAALTNRGGNNSIMFPPEVMGLSSSVNSNSLIGILPVFVQGTNAGWLQPNTGYNINDKNLSVIHAPTVQGSGCITPSGNVTAEKFVPQGQNDNQQQAALKLIPSISQQPGLSSSDTVMLSSADTVILHSLASQDTIKLPPHPTTKISDSNLMPVQNTLSSCMASSFSLLSNISDRSISLSSIPTVSLFSPEESEVKSVESPSVPLIPVTQKNQAECQSQGDTLTNPTGESKQSHIGEKGSVCNIVEGRKARQDRISESEPSQLQIDESADTDISDTEASDSKPAKDKKRDLKRSDTVILPNEELTEEKEKNSALETSDTVIFTNAESSEIEKHKSRSSGGFTLESLPGTSLETQNVPSSNNPISVLTSDQNQTSGLELHTLQPVPNIILTKSMVDGTYNPNLVCSLLSQSQTSGTKQPSFYTNFMSDQLEAVNFMDQCSPLQSTANVQNIQISLPSSAQETLPNPSSDVFYSTTSSVKGTQTDWIFGNAPILFKPVKLSDNNEEIPSKENHVMESTNLEGSVPSSVILGEDTEDIISGPLILDEQAVPVSVLNLIPPNINLITSTANMQQIGEQTMVSEVIQADSSKALFPCAKCDQAFLSKKELSKHMKSHKKILKCDLCTSTFTKMGNYTRHRKIHNLQPGSQNVFTCEYCQREFLQRCDLRRHLLIHTKQEPHRCSICGKGYIRRSDLVVHTRFHNKEKVFKCDMCDKSFFQSGDLNRHIRRAHKPNSLLTCGHCERKYACETTLIRHMKVVHKDIILRTVNKRLEQAEINAAPVIAENAQEAENANDQQEEQSSPNS